MPTLSWLVGDLGGGVTIHTASVTLKSKRKEKGNEEEDTHSEAGEEEEPDSEETEDEDTYSEGRGVDPDTHLTDSDSEAADSDSEESSEAAESEAKQSDAEIYQIKLPYSSENEARDAARLCDGRFNSVNSERGTYCCPTDGCNTVCKVRHDKVQGHYSILTILPLSAESGRTCNCTLNSTFDGSCLIKRITPPTLPWLNYNRYTGMTQQCRS